MTIFRFSLLAFAVAMVCVYSLWLKHERDQNREMSITMQIAAQCKFPPKFIHRIASDAAYAAGKIAVSGNYLDYQIGRKDERLDCLENALGRAQIDFEDLTIKARADVPVPIG